MKELRELLVANPSVKNSTIFASLLKHLAKKRSISKGNNMDKIYYSKLKKYSFLFLDNDKELQSEKIVILALLERLEVSEKSNNKPLVRKLVEII